MKKIRNHIKYNRNGGYRITQICHIIYSKDNFACKKFAFLLVARGI